MLKCETDLHVKFWIMHWLLTNKTREQTKPTHKGKLLSVRNIEKDGNFLHGDNPQEKVKTINKAVTQREDKNKRVSDIVKTVPKPECKTRFER